MKRLLNVGGGSKSIPLPAELQGFEHQLLDIDPAGKPDIVLDGRKLNELPAADYDAVYCSHNQFQGLYFQAHSRQPAP